MQKINPQDNSTDLSFYPTLPIEKIDYGTFKSKIEERLLVLKKIEQSVNIGEVAKNSKDDHVGHFLLKLVSAQTRWSCNWFVRMETLLFKTRTGDQNKTREFFAKKFWPRIRNLKIINNEVLFTPLSYYDPDYINEIDIPQNFKIHFTKCSSLISKRKQPLIMGYMDSTYEAIECLLHFEFQRTLENSSSKLYENNVFNSDERLVRLNKELFISGEQATTKKMDSELQQNLFPLCIKGIVDKLKKNRHLKFNDRQTLCLFLKDIGYSLQNCIKFFESHFNCTEQQFKKEYLYNIRHNYGLEGKRANYTSFKCPKIISLGSEPNSVGCPFSKNIDYVRKNNEMADLEDFGKNPMKCCSKFGGKMIKAEENVEISFTSPAEHYKALLKGLFDKSNQP